MICKNCGGEYADNDIKCPYCGSENKIAAGRKKKEILHSYDVEAAKIRKQAEDFPEKTANRWTQNLLRIVGILAAIGVLITVIAIIWANFSTGLERRNEQRHIKKLEELYQAENYEEMDEYMDDKELWGREYDKYDQLTSVYQDYSRMEEHIRALEEIIDNDVYIESQKEELARWRLEEVLYYASRVLKLCRSNIDDMVYHENEDRLEGFYKNCVQKLKGFGYSDAQIEQIANWDRKSSIEELIQIIRDYYFA